MSSAPVLVVTHLPDPNLGLIPDALADHGLAIVHRNLFTDATLPGIDEIAALVSLGGQMSVTDLGAFRFLAEELERMRACRSTSAAPARVSQGPRGRRPARRRSAPRPHARRSGRRADGREGSPGSPAQRRLDPYLAPRS
jgi:hypothetical protein